MIQITARYDEWKRWNSQFYNDDDLHYIAGTDIGMIKGSFSDIVIYDDSTGKIIKSLKNTST